MTEVLIAAAVALFVLSRLYIALGRDDGPPNGRSRSPAQGPVSAPAADRQDDQHRQARQRPVFSGPASAGLEEIYEADNSFDPDEFRRGARTAYEMIIAAFARGDREALKPLLDDDVYGAWDAAISERDAAGTDPFELLRIRKSEIVDAELDGEIARVMMLYEAELGDGERTRKANDIWTFKRNVTQTDPNWLLDDVETAE
ncbi:MAG: Tim44/TimA family putative adaptor protein [Pseudomonadota bacterium]